MGPTFPKINSDIVATRSSCHLQYFLEPSWVKPKPCFTPNLTTHHVAGRRPRNCSDLPLGVDCPRAAPPAETAPGFPARLPPPPRPATPMPRSPRLPFPQPRAPRARWLTPASSPCGLAFTLGGERGGGLLRRPRLRVSRSHWRHLQGRALSWLLSKGTAPRGCLSVFWT